jgi:hypothetical protein
MIIYIPYGVGNADGFPADYPRESKRVDDKAEIPDGWIKTTEDEYTRLVQSSYAEVAALNAAREETSRATEREKIQTARQLYADCDAIDNDWANATNAQKFELARKTFKILRRINGLVIDNLRDE